MEYRFKHTEPFQEITNLSYARVHCALCKELKRQEIFIDDADLGYPLVKLLQTLDMNIHGFLACAFIDFEFEAETLALLTDTVIFGSGDCECCGGNLEHDETIIEGRNRNEEKFTCPICGEETYKWIEKNEI